MDRRLTRLGELLRAATPQAATSGDDLDQLLTCVEELLRERDAARASGVATGTRLEELTEVTLALTSLDYERRATIGDAGDVFDALATALNMLGEELRASAVSRSYVTNIIESMTDVLVVVDATGLVKTANQAACELLRHTKNELTGLPVTSLLIDLSLDELLGRNGIRNREATCKSKDGDCVTVSFSASPMFDFHERLEGVVCVARDLTESKRLEAEQLALRDAVQKQAIILEELATPLIPISEHILVAPIIGSMDEDRGVRLTESLLEGIVRQKARVAILDFTGVRNIAPGSIAIIARAARSIGLLGARALVTGIGPDMASELARLDVLDGVKTFGTLQRGIEYASSALTSKRTGG